MSEEKKKKLDPLEIAINTIKQKHGNDSILINQPLPGVEFFDTGSLELNRILGGGWARGRIIELLGAQSTGKSSICLHAIANVQKAGGKAAFVDSEHALCAKYSKDIGVDVDDLIISQPDNGEQALDIVEILVRSGELKLIIVDSVAALVPAAEIDGSMEDQQMGLQARLMSKAMRKLSGIASQTGTTIIFTNQYRSKIGPMGGKVGCVTPDTIVEIKTIDK